MPEDIQRRAAALEEPLEGEIDEAAPLLAARQNRLASNGRLLLLLVICVLERCTFYEYVADVLNSQPSNNSNDYCGILGDNSSLDMSNSWKSQTLLGLAYVLPMLGGFAADWHCGCLRVLQAGCVLYCLGSWLLVCLVYYPPVCTDLLKYLSQAALALAAGLMRPSLMVLSYDIGEPLMGSMAFCHFYYACEALGEVMGCSLAYATDLRDRPLTISCVPTTHVMIVLAICLAGVERTGWNPKQLHVPTWPWVRRFLLVSAPIILLSSVLMLASFTLSGWELTNKANQTIQKEFITNSDLLLLFWSAALLPMVAVLGLLTHFVAQLRPHTRRISLGIGVLIATQFIAFGLSAGLKNTTPYDNLLIAYGSQSVLYALVEALTFVAANEIAFQVAPIEIRTFILGSFMSLKGSGFFTTILILFGYAVAWSENDAHNWSQGSGVGFVHLGLAIILIGFLVFFERLAPRALEWLIQRQEYERRMQELE